MSSELISVTDLYAYNTWANGKVFAACRPLQESQLDEKAPGLDYVIVQSGLDIHPVDGIGYLTYIGQTRAGHTRE